MERALSIFRKVSRVALILFILVLAILVVCMIALPEDAALPGWLFPTFFVILFATVLCVAVGWVLSLARGLRTDPRGTLLHYAVFILTFFVLTCLADRFLEGSVDWLGNLGSSAAIACATQAGEFIFNVRKPE